MKNHLTTKMKKRILKHIVQEGARFHVLRYDTEGVHCSEPDCEINQPNVTPKPKTCECKIRGITELYAIKDNCYIKIHPDSYYKYLRKFKYCPLCGKKIKVVG